MSPLVALSLAVLLADPSAGWNIQAESDGVIVSKRDRPGADKQEFKATGLIDAEPEAVWKVLNDFAAYKGITPYAEKTEIKKVSDDGKVTHLYVLTNPPMISKRDYCVKFEDRSEWNAGAGFMMLTFKISEESPPENDGVVRMKTYDGQWTLVARDGGKKTFAEYVLLADPGGSLPTWLVNKLAGSGLRDMLLTLRKMTSPAAK
jgi:hypothetical protein